jgi:hypothetical protein
MTVLNKFIYFSNVYTFISNQDQNRQTAPQEAHKPSRVVSRTAVRVHAVEFTSRG